MRGLKEETGSSRDQSPSTEKATPKSAPQKEFKAPHETPDAVISGSRQFYARPLGLHGPGRFDRLVSRILRHKPPSQRFLLRIVYRDYQERCTIVHFDPGVISTFVDKLLEAPTVRAVECGELLFKARKSFGSDYDPANFLKMLGELSAPADGASSASTTEPSSSPGMNPKSAASATQGEDQ